MKEAVWAGDFANTEFILLAARFIKTQGLSVESDDYSWMAEFRVGLTTWDSSKFGDFNSDSYAKAFEALKASIALANHN